MKSFTSFFFFSHVAILVSNYQIEASRHDHHHPLNHLHTREFHAHSHSHSLERKDDNYTSVGNDSEIAPLAFHSQIKKTSGKCEFPSDAGLVAVTPNAKNAGWAMSPDQSCSPGSYCPYACPSGQVMAQWNPNAKAYTYPQSMDGGLHCDHDGNVNKPFPEKPYCEPGTGGVTAHNKVGKGVSFCQTVLPGNEAMLIPTHVEEKTDLAVPGEDYWCKTAAHYYINPPGVEAHEACIWGDGSEPIGNWSPYVAGANADSSGQTFVKIGWNPIYTGSKLASTPPSFGVKISCEESECNGTPCSIDPSSHGVGGVESKNRATGAGGADFCVVTVPKGGKANIEVFSTGNSSEPDHEDEPETKPSGSESSEKKNPDTIIPISQPNPEEVEPEEKHVKPLKSNISGGNISNNLDITKSKPPQISAPKHSESESVENTSRPIAQIPPNPEFTTPKNEETEETSLTKSPEINDEDVDNEDSNANEHSDVDDSDDNEQSDVDDSVSHPSGDTGLNSEAHGAAQDTKPLDLSPQSGNESSDAPGELFEVHNDVSLTPAGTKHVVMNNDTTDNEATSFAPTNKKSTNVICTFALITVSIVFYSL